MALLRMSRESDSTIEECFGIILMVLIVLSLSFWIGAGDIFWMLAPGVRYWSSAMASMEESLLRRVRFLRNVSLVCLFCLGLF